MFHTLFSSPALLEAAEKAFVWQDHMGKLLTTAFLSMVPTFEGRYAVVTAIGMGLPTVFSYFLAFICSSIPVPFILLLLRPFFKWCKGRPFFHKLADKLEGRFEKKSGSIRKYSLLGLFIFVAIPLPTTGVWTGSGIAAMLNLRIKHALPVIILGNAIAGLLMLLFGQIVIL